MHPPYIGLHLSFRRDLSPKFENRTKLADEMKEAWWVLGSYDALLITPIESLEQVDLLSFFGQELELGAVSEITFFPLSFDSAADADLTLDPSTIDSDFVDKIVTRRLRAAAERSVDQGPPTRVEKLTESKPRFLCTITFTISPALVQFSNLPSDLLHRILLLAKELRTRAHLNGIHELEIGRSLGTCDLLVLFSTDSIDALVQFNKFYEQVRGLHIADVIQQSHDKSFPIDAHAFASAEATLTINGKRVSELITESSESSIHFALKGRVDCGHENAVCERFRTSLSTTPELGWGSYSIHAVIKDFAALSRVMKDSLFDIGWREANIIDTETHPIFTSPGPSSADSLKGSLSARHAANNSGGQMKSIPDSMPRSLPETTGSTQRDQLDRVPWILEEEPQKILRELGEALERITTNLFPQAVRGEAAELHRAISAALHRHEFLSPVRDLLPFLKRLTEVLQHQEFWDHNVATSPSATCQIDSKSFEIRLDKMMIDFRKTLHHLDRALRNRIDCRRPQPDPQLPTTLERGLSSLMSGYSAALSVCRELFLSPTSEHAPGAGCAATFEACVAAGTKGKITVAQVFGRSDKQLLGGTPQANNQAAAQPSALWLADVSGLQILRPELCFVACLHEVAELTDWLGNRQHPGRDTLRKELIHAIAESVAVGWIDKAVTLDGRFTQPSHEAKLRTVSWVVSLLIASSRNIERSPGQSDSDFCLLVTAAARDYPGSPTAFLDALIEQLDRDRVEILELYERDGQAMNKSRLPSDSGIVAETTDWVKLGLLGNAWFNDIVNRRIMISEIMADTGMWCAFQSTMRRFQQPSGIVESANSVPAADCSNLDRIYRQLMEAYLASVGLNTISDSQIELLMIRWTTQAVALELGLRDNTYIRDSVRTAKDGLFAVDEVISTVTCRITELISSVAPADLVQRITKKLDSVVEPSGRWRKLIERFGSILATISAYGGNQEVGINGNLDPRCEQVCRQFVRCWQSSAAETARVNFAFELWGKAQLFHPYPVLKQVHHCGSDTLIGS